MAKILDALFLIGFGIFILVVHYKPNIFPEVSTKIKNSKYSRLVMFLGYAFLIFGVLKFIR